MADLGIFDKFGKLREDATKEVKPPTPAKEKVVRGLGDMDVIIETQRIYNPAMTPQVPVKGPPVSQLDRGTSSVSDTGGNWGKPEITRKI